MRLKLSYCSIESDKIVIEHGMLDLVNKEAKWIVERVGDRIQKLKFPGRNSRLRECYIWSDV